MDYLALCQEVRREGGMAGTGPSSTQGQTGEMERVVSWTRQAWLDIQSSREDWPALWAIATLPLAAGETELDPPSDLRRLIEARTRFNGGKITHVPWPYAPHTLPDGGAPNGYTVRPDGKLVVWPSPDEDGVVTLEYFKQPQVLVESTDEPWLPRHLQRAIVYQALMYWAVYEDAGEVYQDAAAKLQQYGHRIHNELTAEASLGGPLA